MHYSSFLAIGLVSLAVTTTAIPFNGKPAIAKRVYTATKGSCTAICQDATMEQCLLQCSPTPTLTPDFSQSSAPTTAVASYLSGVCTLTCDQSTGCINAEDWGVCCSPAQTTASTSAPILHKRTTVTNFALGCSVVCWDTPTGVVCDDSQCNGITVLSTPTTVITFAAPVLQKRATVTATFGDCTAVCSDTGFNQIGCDVPECSGNLASPTILPTPKPALNDRAATSGSPDASEIPLLSSFSNTHCKEGCFIDDYDDPECLLMCDAQTGTAPLSGSLFRFLLHQVIML